MVLCGCGDGGLDRPESTAAVVPAIQPEKRGPPDWGLRLTGAQVDLNTTTNESLARELAALGSAGASSVRLPVSWAALEARGDGEYNPSIVGMERKLSPEAELDHAVAEAQRHGLRPLITLFLTPCWASGSSQGCGEEDHSRAPLEAAEYGEAAAFLAERYEGMLAGIEVWNEPDLDQFLAAAGSSDRSDDKRARAEIAASLTRATYAAIEKVSPETPVIAGAVEGADAEFIEMLYEAEEGIADHFDAVSIHPYSHRFPPTDPRQGWSGGIYPDPAFGSAEHSFVRGIPRVRKVMTANGDSDRPLWITEVGWSTCTAVNPAPPDDTNSGGPADTSYRCLSQNRRLSAQQARTEAELLQAEFIGSAFSLLRGEFPYVEAAFLYELRDSPVAPAPEGNDNCSECRFGVLNRRFRGKRAWESGTVRRALSGSAAGAEDGR